jgi:hypothetical protein
LRVKAFIGAFVLTRTPRSATPQTREFAVRRGHGPSRFRHPAALKACGNKKFREAIVGLQRRLSLPAEHTEYTDKPTLRKGL